MKTPKELLNEVAQQLKPYEGNEQQTIAKWLLEDICGLTHSDFMFNEPMIFEQSTVLQNAIERLNKHEPVQYVLGEAEFYGFKFKVNPAVLIPRPETEELIDLILSQVDKKQPLRILDIGTGSGCIAISLAKKLPHAQVSAWDVSLEALAVASTNATLNNAHVLFEQKDALTLTNIIETFDVIVSNPPYVKTSESASMRANVLAFEPHLALFVADENPLIFYEKIFDFAQTNLTENGSIYFEINQALGTGTVNLFTKNGFSATLKQDIFGVDRMVFGRRL